MQVILLQKYDAPGFGYRYVPAQDSVVYNWYWAMWLIGNKVQFQVQFYLANTYNNSIHILF